MTSRGAVVLALFTLSLAGGLITGRGFFFNLAYVWGGLFLIAFAWSRIALRGLEFEREVHSDRAVVGQLLEERFQLTNSSRWAKLWLEVRDLTEIPGYEANLLTGLGLMEAVELTGHSGSAVLTGLRRGGEEHWQVRTVCTQRGRYALGPTELWGGDPFGLFPVCRQYPVHRHIVVLPPVFPLQSFPIPSGRLPGGEALRRRTHQITPNAMGVREYAPGDSLNRIHWRSTAKRGELISKEFEFDPLADVWLILDMSAKTQYALGHRPSSAPKNRKRRGFWDDPRKHLAPSTEEYAVSIGASLAFHLMDRDRNVGLIAHAKSRHVVQPERGAAQLHRLLEALAVLEAEGEHSLRDVLKVEVERVPRGATAIIVTADVRNDVVEAVRELLRLGRSAIVILLEAASFSGPAGSEGLLSGMRLAGAHTHLVRCGDDLGAALNAD